MITFQTIIKRLNRHFLLTTTILIIISFSWLAFFLYQNLFLNLKKSEDLIKMQNSYLPVSLNEKKINDLIEATEKNTAKEQNLEIIINHFSK